MRPAASGDIGALVETYDADALLHPVPHTDFMGRQDGSDGAFRLVPRVGGSGGFDLTPSANGNELTGKSAACGTFTLRRVFPASPSRRPSVAIPSNGGSYRPGDALQDRCQALLRWAERLSREFPALDMRGSMSRLIPKGALLYADDDFIPVFGLPYDAAAAVDSGSSPGRQTILSPAGEGARQFLHAAWKDKAFECRKDPFIRDKGGWVWGHPLFEKLRIEPVLYYGGDFSPAALAHNAQLIRAIRNQLTNGVAAGNQRSFTAGAAELIGLREKIAKQSELLWPSELPAADARITQSLHALAAAEAKRVLTEVEKLTDPVARAKLAATSIGNGTTGFMANLDEKGQIAFGERIAMLIAQPLLTRAGAADSTLKGARDIAALLSDAAPAFDVLGARAKPDYRSEIEGRRDEILKKLVADDVAALRAFPPGLEGLKSSTRWIAEFSQRYGEFASLGPVTEGHAAFVMDRAARLRAALPEAEAALQKVVFASPVGKYDGRELLLSYLSWGGDARIADAVEYESLAARFGIASPLK